MLYDHHHRYGGIQDEDEPMGRHVEPVRTIAKSPPMAKSLPGRYSDGDDCKRKIEDLHASSQVIIDRHLKKLDAKCERILADEITQKKADILIRKNQHLDQFKAKLKDHIKDQQNLCEQEAKLQTAKDSLAALIKRGAGLSSADNMQISKLQTDVKAYEQTVAQLKATVASNEARMTDQEPDLDGNPSGSACSIM